MLSTFLNELDGIQTLSKDADGKTVLVVAVCQDKSAMDEALLRPGRLHQHVALALPTQNDVAQMLERGLARVEVTQTVYTSFTESTVAALSPSERVQWSQTLARSMVARHWSGADVHHFLRRVVLHALKQAPDTAVVAGETRTINITAAEVQGLLRPSPGRG